jgi:hypothetical protein
MKKEYRTTLAELEAGYLIEYFRGILPRKNTEGGKPR